MGFRKRRAFTTAFFVTKKELSSIPNPTSNLRFMQIDNQKKRR